MLIKCGGGSFNGTAKKMFLLATVINLNEYKKNENRKLIAHKMETVMQEL